MVGIDEVCVLGYAVQDPSVWMDLHMSRAVMSVGATGRQIRGYMGEDARADVAYIHFYAVCPEHRDKSMVCRGV